MNGPSRTPPSAAEELSVALQEEVLSPSADGVADTEAHVHCPWCGSSTTIGLDPGSGVEQAYAEDCPVCCRAWSVAVRYGPDGRARVHLDREGDV